MPAFFAITRHMPSQISSSLIGSSPPRIADTRGGDRRSGACPDAGGDRVCRQWRCIEHTGAIARPSDRPRAWSNSMQDPDTAAGRTSGRAHARWRSPARPACQTRCATLSHGARPSRPNCGRAEASPGVRLWRSLHDPPEPDLVVLIDDELTKLVAVNVRRYRHLGEGRYKRFFGGGHAGNLGNWRALGG